MEWTNEKIIKALSPTLSSTYKEVENEINVGIQFNTTAAIFLMIFRELFMSEDRDYIMSDGRIGSSPSNLTYSIAYSFITTAKLMGLDCVFEAEGKRDAVIQNKDGSKKILYCEWEWNYKDVFGKGKEIDKLIKSTRKNKLADGFLFTYVPEDGYTEYLLRVAEQWQKVKKKYEEPPLTLMTILFNMEKGLRTFKTIRTAVIYNDNITFWEDLSYIL